MSSEVMNYRIANSVLRHYFPGIFFSIWAIAIACIVITLKYFGFEWKYKL